MEMFEEVAIRTAPAPPSFWGRYVDDTFVVMKRNEIESFTQHINTINPSIRFTIEREQGGSLAMLDTLLHRQLDGSLKVTIYRKATHTDQYLAFDSHHPLQHKYGVVRTLMHRAETLVTTSEDKEEEKKKVKSALAANGYGSWIIQDATKQMGKNRAPRTHQTNRRHKSSVTMPYVQGVSEALRRFLHNTRWKSTSNQLTQCDSYW